MLKGSVHNLRVVIKWVILCEVGQTLERCTCTYYYMSFCLCDELSADSVPNEDVYITYKLRRLDKRDKEIVKFPLHPWLHSHKDTNSIDVMSSGLNAKSVIIQKGKLSYKKKFHLLLSFPNPLTGLLI